MTSTETAVAVFADAPCPDCDAPAGHLCHWYCPRYADSPTPPAGTGDDPDAL